MSGYLAMAWSDAEAPAAAALKAGVAEDGAWRQVVDRRNLAVFLDPERPLPCVQLPGLSGVVIGPVFDTAAARRGIGQVADLSRCGGADAERSCRRLVAAAFGAYVHVAAGPGGGLQVFRDPLGALECLTWRRDGVWLAASHLDPASPVSPARIEIDWQGLASLLRQKTLSSVTVPLIGVEGLDPGVLRLEDGRSLRLWRPGDYAARADRDVRPADLAAVVDGCVAAWAQGKARILCEVSGGLDSAIVAAALRRADAPVLTAINHAWAEPEADERRFARAVAEQAGFPLAEEMHGLMALSETALVGAARAARPSFSAADPGYDETMSAWLEKTSADALFTGQGGDAVFYQMAPAALATDLWRGTGRDQSLTRALGLLARRTRRTMWGLIAEAARDARRPVKARAPVSFLAADYAAPAVGDRHPWLQDLGRVTPGKAAQIQALANNQSMFGESLRAGTGRLVQPLMSQPVVELCLQIAAPRLAIGETDRPFARAAFAERLPPLVRERRWKGDLSVFFAKSLAANLSFLRPFLLEGALAGQGLIDRGALDAILQVDELIWFDHSGEITIALLLEAWARRWSGAARSR